jgi:hypothetical protein
MPERGGRPERDHPHARERRQEQETEHEFDRQPLAHSHVPLSALDANDGHDVEEKSKHRWQPTDPGSHFIQQHTKIVKLPRNPGSHSRPAAGLKFTLLPEPHAIQPGHHSQHDGQKRRRLPIKPCTHAHDEREKCRRDEQTTKRKLETVIQSQNSGNRARG